MATTKEDVQRLEAKVDHLTSLMEQILQKLHDATIIAKEPIVKAPKFNKRQAETDAMRKRIKITMEHSRQLQKQFNLLTPPHYNRIVQYLATNDPNVFDGLKRNGEQAPGFRKSFD